MKLPPRTVERLSKYRRLLSKYYQTEGAHIFSHDLARMLNLTPVQVRRDLMLVGLTGNHRKGYSIQKLIALIGNTIDSTEGHNIAIFGIGNLGRAVTAFIRKNQTKMNIVAAFDIDPEKVNNQIEEVPCFHISEITRKVRELSVEIAILTVSPDAATDITNILVKANVKGILNFTSVHLDVPSDVYLKNYDIITSLEEIGFYIKDSGKA